MNMFSSFIGLMGGMEKKTYETIQSALEDVKEELGCEYKDFIIAIKPMDEKLNFKCFIMRDNFVMVREITIKEIVGGEPDN